GSSWTLGPSWSRDRTVSNGHHGGQRTTTTAAQPRVSAVMVAPMRGANTCRWASGGIVWSPSATRNQVGSDVQAGTPITSPRVLPDNGWPVLAGQDLARPGDVVGQPGQRELGCGDAVPVGLQVLDDGAPTGAVGPGAVHEDDVGQ